METCKICKKDYKNLLSLRAHVLKTHKIKYTDYRKQFGITDDATKYVLICENCGKEFSSNKPNTRFCQDNNRLCATVWNSKQKFKGVDGIAECQICGMLGNSLVQHLENSHNMSVPEYESKYNIRAYSKSYLQKCSNKIKGSLNPGYQHNGKLSQFSKHYIGYEQLSLEKTEEKIKKCVDDANKTKRENESYEMRIGYWLKKGYSEIEAKKKLKERQQTFSKEICIEKYGEVEGLKRWEERQKKWQDNLKSKSPEEIERINRAKLHDYKGYSKISQRLFEDVYHSVALTGNKYYFATLQKNGEVEDTGYNNEYCFHTENSVRFLDFYDATQKKIIEFDGDYWHGNTTAKKRDIEREHEILETDSSIQIMRIKEQDYNKSPETVIDECVKFLNG